MRSTQLLLIATILLKCSVSAVADHHGAESIELSPETLLTHYSVIEPVEFKGRQAIHIRNTPANPNAPVALAKDVKIENAIIEVDIASERFAGVAFRAQDGDRYDKVYFRPFNSGTDRHKNSVQYVVGGNHSLGWRPLRESFPGKFESGADLPVMEWFRARFVIRDDRVETYVNEGSEPVLVVDRTLSGFTEGGVGIWGWDAYFANMTIKHLPASKPRPTE